MKIVIGIDTGVNTGYAVWSNIKNKLIEVETLMIHQAMDGVLEYHKLYGKDLLVRFEDARQRKWYGDSGREKLQGAGSVKRDAKIWEDFLTDNLINHEAVAPSRNTTKVNAGTFKAITKWDKRTSEHGRDAAMLCFKHK